jgi:hypothetical protein
MKTIRQIITDNQEEFNEMIINFLTEKGNEVPQPIKSRIKQRKKKLKTVCHFNTMGKNYDSNVFTDNYREFLTDISRVHQYELFEKTLGTFTKYNLNDFTDTTREKATVIKLKCGGFVSTYSSTKMKMEHVKNVCDELGYKVNFNIK